MQELTSGNKTIGEIVAADFRTAKIFENHGIDFCCGGKNTLETICAEKGLELVSLSRELEAVHSETTDRSQNYSSWSLPFLADYIVNTHHAYLKENDEQIAAYARKMSGVHGSHHPEVIRISAIFDKIATDMTARITYQKLKEFEDDLYKHVHLENNILFPKATEL
jgi:regulator of cell morphogenesis and NO signaling